jgi:hypothetical protein
LLRSVKRVLFSRLIVEHLSLRVRQHVVTVFYFCFMLHKE